MNTRLQFRALLRVQAKSLLHSMFSRSKKGKNNSTGTILLVALLFLFAFGMVAISLGSMFFGIGSIATSETLWIYFGLAVLASFALMFFGSIFATQNHLFNAKDNDLLISMPVPPQMILASRIAFLYLLNLFFELLVMLPAGVVYPLVAASNPAITIKPMGVISYLFVLLLLPLLSLALSCLIGWGIAAVTARIPHKNVVTTVLSFLAMGVYFYFCFSLSDYMETVIEKGMSVFAGLSHILPLQWFGRAISEGSFLDLLLSLLVMILPFLLVYWLLSRSFIRIVTTKVSAKKTVYKGGGIKQKSTRGTLLHKEMRRLVTTPVYLLNSCTGMFFDVMIGIFACFKAGDLLNTISLLQIETGLNVQPMIAPICIAILCAANCMNCISASSISLEGKTLWILKSSPVKPLDVLFAKAALHALICLPPTIIISLLLGIALRFSAMDFIFAILISSAWVIFCALLGVVVNLKFPKFDWTNETIVVKQSVCLPICMLGTLAFLVIPAALFILFYVLTQSTWLCMGILFAAFIGMDALLWLLLRGWGVKTFEKLET